MSEVLILLGCIAALFYNLFLYREELVDTFIDYVQQHDTSNYHIEGYMSRWWIVKKHRWIPFVMRLHCIHRSDSDRHLHDHVAWNISVPIRNRYDEEMPAGKPKYFPKGPPEMGEAVVTKRRGPGSVVFRKATSRHRLTLCQGEPVWSIFICGKNTQDWGFYVPNMGKIWWRWYLNDWKSD